jgi:hypothetical protein
MEHTLDTIPYHHSPIDRLMSTTLKSLGDNKSITIKPADKNLGLVVMNTSDYKLMCLKHLEDTSTYQPVANYFPNELYAQLRANLKKNR